jgi:hypothetical protein
MKTRKPSSAKKGPGYVLCTNAGEYRVDLHFGRVYPVAKPYPNDPAHLIRIVDESGEDYLYPRDWFVAVDLPPKARRALQAQTA